MKILVKTIAAGLLFLTPNLFAQPYGLGDANFELFSKYRVPETSLSIPQITGSLNWDNNVRDILSNNFLFSSKREYDGIVFNILPRYVYLFESEKKDFRISTKINSGYLNSEIVYNSFDATSKSKSSDYFSNFYVNPSLRIYRNAKSLFSFYINADLELQISENNNKQTGNNSSSSYFQEKQQIYSFEAGASFGRIRNVTPLISAFRLQERMKRINMIHTNLSDESLLNIAQKFSQYNYYSAVNERSEKYFWGDLEKLLKSSIPGYSGLNEYASAYIHEIPGEIRFIRYEGYRFDVFAKLDYENRYTKGSFYITRREEDFYLMPGVSFVLSKQLNLNSQFDMLLKTSGGPNLTGNSDSKQRYDFYSSAGLSYELTDRLVCELNSSLNLMFMNYKPQGKQSSLINNLTLMYFIEDFVSLNANLNWQITETKNLPNSIPVKYNIKTVQLGFTYFFNRGFIIN